jgi:DNA replication and repair protein RecF
MSFEPQARFNVFVGDNGQGKTNLLEAIFAIATLRSFRTTRLTDLVRFGAERATLAARVRRHDLTRLYEVELAQGSRKVRLDGKAMRPLARYFGGFNVVVFTPEDLGLPRGSRGDRRRFLDRSVFNLHPGYLALAGDYDKILKQRNMTLKLLGKRNDEKLVELLDVYDQQLAELGMAVIQARRAFVEAIQPGLAAAFATITRTGFAAGASYACCTPEGSADSLREELVAGRARDLATGMTHTGPHRDDLVFELDGKVAGSFASQGQLRAILLAWKTAELAVIARAHGEPPLLLLDDVSSELDPSRNAYLFEHLEHGRGQCFITTTHARHVLLVSERHDYRLVNGRISS